MKRHRIKSPQEIKKLMQELWSKYQSGDRSAYGRIFWVDLPEPTKEEKRIMAENRANRKPAVFDENELQARLDAARENFGGW